MQSSGISSLASSTASRSPGGQAPSRFALSGRSAKIDHRIEAVRRDLADVRLAGSIFAPHYAAAIAKSAVAQAPIRADRAADAPVLSEILPGERFELLELSGDTGWGICAADGVVGYVNRDALGEPVTATHVVAVASAPVRAEASNDAPIVGTLPMGARLTGDLGAAFHAADGGFVAAEDLRPLSDPMPDFVAVAEMLVGVPTVPGGRSGAGVNCTGLVFLSLSMAGFLAPRFCNLQAEGLGRALGDDDAAKRGDLVFFDDHAAIVVEADTAIHAGADAVETIVLSALNDHPDYGPITARRRVA